MIYGIGTDIVRIQRMADNLGRYGVRFAAKEAAAKALGTGFRGGLSLRDIGVDNDALGKPVLAFSAHAREVLQNRGVGHTHLSLSDESEYAIAYVVLEADPGESQ